jgi:hypothetical protein
MNEFKLIVAGGRDFDDYVLVHGQLMELASTTYRDKAVSIVSGMARGADALGARFAKVEGVRLYEFPANWDQYGKRAGFMRNEQMGRFSDGLLAFWDTRSKGTAHMIEFMRKLNKPVHIITY